MKPLKLVPLVALVLALLAGAVRAKELPTGEVTLVSQEGDALSAAPERTLVFHIDVKNAGAAPKSLALSASATSSGTLDHFQLEVRPGSVLLAGNESVRAEFIATPKRGAPPGSYGFEFKAFDNTVGSEATLVSKLPLTITVLEVPAEAPREDPINFTITSAFAARSAAPGEWVTARFHLRNLASTDPVPVTIGAKAPEGWIVEPPGTRTLHGKNDLVTFDVPVRVPASAKNGTSGIVLVVARSDDNPSYERSATVRIDVIAPAARAGTKSSTEAPAPSTSPTKQATSGPTGTPPASAPPPATGHASFELVLSDSARAFAMSPGSSRVETVYLRNTGNLDLFIVLDSHSYNPDLSIRVVEPFVQLSPGAAAARAFEVMLEDRAEQSGSAFPWIRATSNYDQVEPIVVSPAITFVPPAQQGGDETREVTGPTILSRDPGVYDALAARVQKLYEDHGAAPFVIGGGVAVTGAAAVYVGRSRRAQDRLWWLALGAYTRLTRPRLLDHGEREKLYHVIEHAPGIHFHALQRELSWNTGTLTYHLRVLERHKLITSRKDQIMRRFYVAGSAPRDVPPIATPDQPGGLRGDVLNAIRSRHGVNQAVLATELGTSKQTLNYHVKNLERLGLIRVVRQGRETVLFPADPDEDAGPGAASPPVPPFPGHAHPHPAPHPHPHGAGHEGGTPKAAAGGSGGALRGDLHRYR